MKLTCDLCPHFCGITEGRRGICKVRTNTDGRIHSSAYGLLTSVALDPIEKKPFARFCPGSMILSVGGYGCNMRCAFCQNWRIAASDGSDLNLMPCRPDGLVREAVNLRKDGNIGLAYTYNEPLVNYEYVYDCAKLARAEGLKNVLVTNGMINEEPFKHLLEYIDAANIDLKSFSPDFYRDAGGDLDTVKNSIRAAAEKTHLEVTTLVIAGLNDSDSEMEAEFRWLSEISSEIPLHLSRFFPHHKMREHPPTPINRLFALKETADRYLRHVYLGNI